MTDATIELATELDGEHGYPVGMSEPNMTRKGEEWLLQHAAGRPAADLAAPWSPRMTRARTRSPSTTHRTRPRRCRSIQYKAKQRIAEAKKLRQYYRKPDNEERRKILKMKTQPPRLWPTWTLVQGIPAAKSANVVDDAAAEWALLGSMCSTSAAAEVFQRARRRTRSVLHWGLSLCQLSFMKCVGPQRFGPQGHS